MLATETRSSTAAPAAVTTQPPAETRVARPCVHRAVVVHAGARDAYQLAAALQAQGALEALVTDLFWPQDRRWARALLRMLPASWGNLLRQRSAAGVPFARVKLQALVGLCALVLEKVPQVPFAWRRWAQRAGDARLGGVAGRLAARTGAGLVSYSYYGYDAMGQYPGPAMLFQLHPHPATMRRILREELRLNPDCASSLEQEWELALPESEYQHLVAEPQMAARFIVASTFTKASLIEHGADPRHINVIPYGVDLRRFTPAASLGSRQGPLRLLFVGRINQRKGIKYLLQALEQFSPQQVQLTVCGRVLDDLALFRPFREQVTVRPSVSGEELVAAYQGADLFVFPSVAEGFGQVLLESLACGLPILSTTHTAAPDLITEGVEGFVVEPRDVAAIVERIAWALSHRNELLAMRAPARQCAEQFTWDAFRQRTASVVMSYLAELSDPPAD